MRIYLSGPMTGLPDYNYPAFNEAARKLRAHGHDVFNPAEAFEGNQSLTWDEYLRADIKAIFDCDAIQVLPGWRDSVGARLEVILGLALGLRFLEDGYELEVESDTRHAIATLMGIGKPAEESILDEASRLVGGDRQADYGHPYYDFRRTALIWTGLFIDRLKDGEVFTARDVPLAMQGVKLSREINHPKRDNRVDGAGYWLTLQMVDDLERTVTEEAL